MADKRNSAEQFAHEFDHHRFDDHRFDDQKLKARQKENNPFSEQEKHGPDAHRRSPGDAQEYQGNPSVQRRSPGIEDDNQTEGEDQERG